VTGRRYDEIIRDLLDARVRLGFSPQEYTAFLLWDVPRANHRDFLRSKELDPFLIRLLCPEDRAISHDKVACADRDRELGIPWLPSLAVIHRCEGPRPKEAWVVERAVDVWPALEQLTAAGTVAVKPASGMQGRGFYAVSSNREVVDAEGCRVDPDELVRRMFAYRDKHGDFGYLVQPMLEPHTAMVELTGVRSLATLRIVTVKHETGNLTLQALLKIPAPGRLTDNFRRGVSGTFIASLDTESGRLSELVGLVSSGHRYVLERVAAHPITGRKIAGREVPGWRDAIKIAHRAAAARPRSPIFGWDVAMGPSGWVILDANAVWGPTGDQACRRGGLRPTLARLYPDYWA
jgi:hypothetical protein